MSRKDKSEVKNHNERDLFIDFDGLSTSLGLFYAQR